MRAYIKKMIKNIVSDESGQSMVELAVTLPLVLMLLCGIIEFGWLFGVQLSLQNGAREGARYAAIHPGASNIAAEVKSTIAGDPLLGDFKVDVDYRSSAVTVYISTAMRALTPVGGIFYRNGMVDMSSDVTMRIE